MIDRVKIGEFLRDLRKEKDMTQEELAEKFGVSSRSVSRCLFFAILADSLSMVNITTLHKYILFPDVSYYEVIKSTGAAQ